MNIYIFNTVKLLDLFYKVFVKLRYFFIELFILLKLNISVFKVIVHIFLNKVLSRHTAYNPIYA